MPRFDSAEEAEQQGLGKLAQAVSLLEQKATPDDVEAYRRFTVEVSNRVAEAHKEEGQAVSSEEQAAIGKIESALGSS